MQPSIQDWQQLTTTFGTENVTWNPDAPAYTLSKRDPTVGDVLNWLQTQVRLRETDIYLQQFDEAQLLRLSKRWKDASKTEAAQVEITYRANTQLRTMLHLDCLLTDASLFETALSILVESTTINICISLLVNEEQWQHIESLIAGLNKYVVLGYGELHGSRTCRILNVV